MKQNMSAEEILEKYRSIKKDNPRLRTQGYIKFNWYFGRRISCL